MSQSKPLSNAFIRSAAIDEAGAIASLLHQAFVEFEPLYTPAAFAATAPTSDLIQKRWNEGPVWVAEEGGELVGTVSTVAKAEGLYVRSMAVLPSHRGQRMGYALLQTAEQFANTLGIQRMFLSTTPFLKSAIRLYEQFGFDRINDEPHELFGTPLLTMEKLLQSTRQS